MIWILLWALPLEHTRGCVVIFVPYTVHIYFKIYRRNLLKSLLASISLNSSAPLISRHILRLEQLAQKQQRPRCPYDKMYLGIREADERSNHSTPNSPGRLLQASQGEAMAGKMWAFTFWALRSSRLRRFSCWRSLSSLAWRPQSEAEETRE